MQFDELQGPALLACVIKSTTDLITTADEKGIVRVKWTKEKGLVRSLLVLLVILATWG